MIRLTSTRPATTAARGIGLRRALVGALAVAAMIAGTLTGAFGSPPAQAEEQSYESLVGGFESDDEGWSAIPNGASGVFSRDDSDPHSGIHAGALSGSFPGGTGSVEFVRYGLPQVAAEGLFFWLKSDGVTWFTLRMIDSEGQTHQRGVDISGDPSAWQKVTIDSLGGWGHWGGSDDGVWRGSAASIDIILESAGLNTGVTDASLTFDDVTLLSAPPTILLAQTQLGNVFLPDEPTSFDISSAGDTLNWTVTDVNGAVAASGRTTPDAADSTLTVPDDLDLGWYSIKIDAVASGALLGSVNNTFARLTAPPSTEDATHSTFGMGTHLPGYPANVTTLLTRAGIGNVRDDVFWPAGEQQPGVYDWTNSQSYLGNPIAAGIAPLGIPLYGNPLYDGGKVPVSDEGIEAYANFVLAYVGHYVDQGIPAVEIWNEFDLGLDGSTEKSPEAYLKILKAVHAKVKASFPDLPIIGPADAYFSTGWLERFFALGGLDYVDGVVLHPYNFPADAEGLDSALDSVQSLIATYNAGVQKPIWITEIGWSSGQDGQSVSQQSQASNIVRSQLIALSRGVTKSYNYALVNEGVDPVAFYPNLGVLHNQADPLGYLTPKPAYVAFAAMTSQLTGADFVRRENVGDRAYSMQFTKDGQQVRALWSLDPKLVDVLTDEPLIVTSMYGEPVTYQPGPGARVTIPVSRDLQYVVGGSEAMASGGSLVLDPAFVNSPVSAHWTFDNSDSAGATTVQLTIAGLTVEQTVAAGASATLDFTLPARDTEGTLEVSGTVLWNGDRIGTLYASTTVTTAVTLRGARAIDSAGTSVLRLTLTNQSPDAIGVLALSYEFGSTTGSALQGTALAGSAAAVVDVPIGTLAGPTDWVAEADVDVLPQVAAEGTLLPTPDSTPVGYHPVSVDGAPDDLTGLPVVDLDTAGTVTMPAGNGGAPDLGGRIWLTWDDANLYLSARITDDTHAQFAVDGLTWQGDSVQLAITPGAPGEQQGTFSEMGFALTSAGPQAWRFSSPNDPIGPIAGSSISVVRDEASKVTDYEVAVPWERLDGIRPVNGVLSASIVVNDNDGAGRDGFIEWGSGIASGKNPDLFRFLQLVAPPRSSDATLSALLVDGIAVAGFDPATLGYAVELPYGTTAVPTVTATQSDPGATSVVSQAASPTGRATVTVTAEDGTVVEYHVQFSVASHQPCTETITGTVSSVTVTHGVTCLTGATVSGSVTVIGGALTARDSRVKGSYLSRRGGQQQLIDTRVEGSVLITAATGIVTVERTTVSKGAVFLANHAVTISGSTFARSLTCLLNSPAPTNDGHPNTVTGHRVGQCGRGF